MRFLWSFNKCKEVALKYKTKIAFRNGDLGAYKFAHRTKILDDVCSHMVKNRNDRNYWTYEKCKEESLKYIYRKDFHKFSNGAYLSALNNKWLDNICTHMKKNKFYNMRTIFRKILTLMKGSVMTRGGKESSTRIMSYVISAIIVIFCFVFIGLEIKDENVWKIEVGYKIHYLII